MNELNLIEEGGNIPVYDDALRFDRNYQDGVILGLNFVTGARTVSFWLKPFYTTFNGMSREFLMAQYGNSGQRTFYMEINANGVLNALFSTTSSGNNFATIQSNAGQFFDASQWYHICFTIESAGLTKLYVDGVQQTMTHPNTLQLSRSGGTFCWGRFRPTSTTLIGSSIQKELAVWTTSRTQSEVVADMTRVYTGAETGLKAYFPTNEGSGNTVQDINLVYTGSIQTFNTTPNYIDDVMWIREIVGSVDGSIEKSRIDLFEDQFVSITKQSFDVNNLKQRLSGVTNNFTLPFTANNSEVFDYLDLNGNVSNKPYQINYVEYIQDGTPIIKKGRLNLREVSAAGYKVDVTHGINDFFDRIRDKFLYEPFESRKVNILSMDSGSIGNSNDLTTQDNEGIVIPLCDYGFTNPLPTYQQSPYAFVKKAFDFIAEDVGYTFVDGTNGRLDDLLFGGGKLYDYVGDKVGLSDYFSTSTSETFKLGSFVTNKTGFIFSNINYQTNSVGGSFNAYVNTYIDGVLESSIFMILGTNDLAFFTSSTVYPRGTKIEVEIDVVSVSSGPTLEISILDFPSFNVSKIGTTDSLEIYYENIFKDLTQLDFITHIFELFNLAFEVDQFNKVVTAYSLNEVYDSTLGNTIDFSDYFSNVMNKKFNSDYGKVNRFNYQYEDGFPVIFNSTLNANNTNKEKVIIESGITASFADASTNAAGIIIADGSQPFTLRANGYDTIDAQQPSSDIGLRVCKEVRWDTNVHGTIQVPVITESGTTFNMVGTQTFISFNGLDWSSLIEDNYSSLRDNVLNRYQEVKLLMRVPRHLIDSFSFQNKIFIEQLNSKFVVQSIKTRPDGLSEWILIKLN